MSSPNSKWSKWIFASVVQHFRTELAKTSGVSIYFEGMHKDNRTNNLQLEIRFDGPYYKELSKNYWEVKFEVNILVQAVIGSSFLTIHKGTGIAAAAFTDSIKIYKYGEDIDDDESLFDCSFSMGKIIISHFGQLNPNEKILQASVEGQYKFEIKN